MLGTIALYKLRKRARKEASKKKGDLLTAPLILNFTVLPHPRKKGELVHGSDRRLNFLEIVPGKIFEY